MTSKTRASLVRRITILLYGHVTRGDVTEAVGLANRLLQGHRPSRKHSAKALKHLASTYNKQVGSDGFNDELESVLHEVWKIDPDAYDRGVETMEARRRG